MYEGVFTAIITPFNEDENVDEEALKNLIDFQIEGGVTGIVPCGTTGESPTLSPEEHDKVIKLTVKHVDKRVLVIAGTGSNCTREAVERTKHAAEAGADAALIVNPYYNKPTQQGLYLHFKTIADSVDIPIIVYNIQGRTGVNIETETLMRLVADCKNIVAVKEASGNLDQMKDVISKRPENFSVLSGDDNMTLDLIKAGGNGVISVASNIVPKEMVKLTTNTLNKNYEEAEKTDKTLTPLFEVEFIETNPIPIKSALSMKGMCKEIYRLPMCKIGDENREKLKTVIQNLGII